MTLFYMSIEMLALKDAVTLFFCSPVIAVMLEWMVTGDAVNARAMVGCLFTVFGVFLITQPGVSLVPRTGTPLGVVVALLAATCNAIAFVIVRALGGRQSALALTWWFHLVVMSVTAIPLAARYPSPPVVPTPRQCAFLLSVVAAQFFGQLLLNRGFQLVSATQGSAINVLQVVFSYIWELTILKASTNLLSLGGGACVVAGVLAVAASGAQRPAARTPSSSQPHASAALSFLRTGAGDQEEGEGDLTYLWVSGTDHGTGGPGESVPKLVRVVDGATVAGSGGSMIATSAAHAPQSAYEPPALGNVVLVVPVAPEDDSASGGSQDMHDEGLPLLPPRPTWSGPVTRGTQASINGR